MKYLPFDGTIVKICPVDPEIIGLRAILKKEITKVKHACRVGWIADKTW